MQQAPGRFSKRRSRDSSGSSRSSGPRRDGRLAARPGAAFGAGPGTPAGGGGRGGAGRAGRAAREAAAETGSDGLRPGARGQEDTTTITELVNAYAAWASRGDALEARRLIVKQLLRIEHEGRLRRVAPGVALDTTPRKQDPLWNDLVRASAAVERDDDRLGTRSRAHRDQPEDEGPAAGEPGRIPPGKLSPDQQRCW